jgi:hypothetical protein
MHRTCSEVWRVMSVSAVLMLSLRSSVYGNANKFGPQTKKFCVIGSGTLVAPRFVPCAQSIAREEFQLRTSHCKWHFTHWRYQHIIQQLEISLGVRSSFQEYCIRGSSSTFRAPCSYRVLVWWWASTVMYYPASGTRCLVSLSINLIGKTVHR